MRRRVLRCSYLTGPPLGVDDVVVILYVARSMVVGPSFGEVPLWLVIRRSRRRYRRRSRRRYRRRSRRRYRRRSRENAGPSFVEVPLYWEIRSSRRRSRETVVIGQRQDRQTEENRHLSQKNRRVEVIRYGVIFFFRRGWV